ncbi:MAG: hypothetical protein RI953_1129 [Pseudomonadota bacterium]
MGLIAWRKLPVKKSIFRDVIFGIARFAGFVFLTACASLQITTEPAGAELTAISASGGAPVSLGKSPVSLNSSKLGELVRQGPALIRANIEGHESATLLVPTSLRGELRASLNLKKLVDPKASEQQQQQKPSELNNLVRDILDAERGIIEKRYDDAQRLTVKIREKYPNLAISYFLEGSIQFQKGEIQAAVASLTRGTELDPDDTVTRNFIEQIKKGNQPKPN